jgi:hypothetical protein
MATAQAVLTPTTNTTPAVVSIPAGELSGAQWVARFPTSVQVSDCVAPFQGNLTSFLAALQAAGAAVSIAATLRPVERAYLMHWCWKIVNEGTNAQTIPARPGVNILWAHTDAAGAYSESLSASAAQAMVNGYGMQNLGTAPALNSKHVVGLAVDMSISWTGDLSIADASAIKVAISSLPRSGMNTDLHTVGATYGVIKYNRSGTDRPHWSDTGN